MLTRNALYALLAVAAAGFSGPLSVRADTWRGTAPFCDGECLRGEEQVGVSDQGDGGYCITGHKVLCRNSQTSCQATATQASCYGVVMVCENGYRETLNNVWHTCTTYACGACIGFGSLGPLSTGGGGGGGEIGTTPLPCKSGYVWREAYYGDHVCVLPATRAQAATDNATAADRREPGGGASGPDTCRPGFVWREADPTDHVCVTPETRSAAADDNRRAAEHTNQPLRVALDTCKQGFVWREAVGDDRVCVTPETREQAASDNAAAAERRQPGSDACKPGFVWREVVPADHVCVTPETRASVAGDTAMAPTRVAGG